MASFSTSLRDARSNAIVTEAGANAKLTVYTAGYGAELYTSTCAAVLGTVAGGLLTFNPVADATATGAGDAAIARLFKNDGVTMVIEGLTVGLVGTNIIVSAVTIAALDIVTTTSATILEGNA